MAKPKPAPARNPIRRLPRAEMLAARRIEQLSRTPLRESRTRIELRVVAGAVVPHRRHTMFDGIRINRAGLPRSRTWRNLPARNFLGEPRR